MLEIPVVILPWINLLIYGASAFVVFALIWGNILLVKRLENGQFVHYLPSVFVVLATIASLTFSYTGIYEQGLDQLPSPLGLGIGIPITILLLYAIFSKSLRELVRVTPLSWLIIPQISRVSGLAILLLVWSDVLAPHVGLQVGWGDIATAVLALLILLALYKTSLNKKWVFAWNTFGLLDFVLAATLTVLTLPTTIQVFQTVPDSTILAAVPVGIAPTLYVPLLYLLHFCVYIKLNQVSDEDHFSSAPRNKPQEA